MEHVSFYIYIYFLFVFATETQRRVTCSICNLPNHDASRCRKREYVATEHIGVGGHVREYVTFVILMMVQETARKQV